MNKLKQQKGITLVALVITIVILIILAGVSIVLIFSDNGIIKKAQIAKNETEKSQEEERQDINNLEKELVDLTSEYVEIPIMTSETTPSGVITASSIYDSSYLLHYVCDRDDDTAWISNITTNPRGIWIQYEFEDLIIPKKTTLKLVTGTNSLAGVTVRVQAYNEENIWEDITEDISVEGEEKYGYLEEKTVDLNCNKKYKKFRIYFISGYSHNSGGRMAPGVREWNIIGIK